MIKEKIGKLTDRFVNGGDTVTTFLRSSVSSQLASWTDNGIATLFFAFVLPVAWLSTVIGAICGGVLNCVINYKFTFHASSQPVKAVIVKYAMVWVGSLVLNAVGTQLVTDTLGSLTFLQDLGFKPTGYFAAAKLSVSLIVSIFWNFLLQKNFVYKSSNFDPIAIRIANFFIPRNYKSSEHN